MVLHLKSLLFLWILILFWPNPSNASVPFYRLQQIVRKNPSNLQAVYALGKCYEKRRRFRTAIKLWSYISKRKPRAWGVRNRIGRAYLRMDKLEKARDVFEIVLKGDSANSYAKKALAFVYRHIDPAPTVDKEMGESDFNEGLSFYYSAKYNKGLSKFKSALINRVRVPECHYYIGECKLKEADDIDGAIESYETALTMSSNPKSLMGLAFAYGLKGEVPIQIEYFEKVLAQDSGFGEAHFQLSMAYDKVDNSRKTFEHAQKAIKIDPSYKKKLRILIKNSNVARKIGKIITNVLEDTEASQLTDEQIERYAAQIGKILGEDNLRADLTNKEGKQRIRNLVGDPIRRRRLIDAYKNRNSDEMKAVFRESDIDVDVDASFSRYR